MKHITEVVPDDMVRWRGWLRFWKSAAMAAFNLSVVRPLFEYLKAAGAVELNPASTKLVSPPFTTKRVKTSNGGIKDGRE